MNLTRILFLVAVVLVNHSIKGQDLDLIAAGIQNSHQQAQKNEKFQLNKYKAIVTRLGPLLTLKLDSGRKLRLKDNIKAPDQVVYYSFREYYDGPKVFVIHRQYYEGNDFMLVNSSNGDTLTIFGKPKLSPNQKKLVSYNVDFAGFSSSGLQVVNLDKNRFQIEFEYEALDWGPTDAFWRSNNEIEVDKFGPNGQGEFINLGKTTFIYNGTWKEK